MKRKLAELPGWMLLIAWASFAFAQAAPSAALAQAESQAKSQAESSQKSLAEAYKIIARSSSSISLTPSAR